MKIVDERFTRRDFDLLPEGFPAQLVDGMLVKEAPPTYGHGRFAARIHSMLVARVGPDRAPASPVGVLIDEWNVFLPDVVVLGPLPPDDARYVGIPLLVVEVLSPSTARRDRRTKRRRLIEAGVAEVWLVDPGTRTVEMHDASGARVARGEEVLRSAAVPGFEVSPARLFDAPRDGPTPSETDAPPGI
jgi:Uma2 family endonuclease